MFKLRNIYLYLVSFVTLMMIVWGIISTVQNLTDVIYPTNYSYYDKSLTNTTDQEKLNQAMQKINDEMNLLNSKKSVVKAVAVVVVALPTFAYHWRKIEKEKKEN